MERNGLRKLSDHHVLIDVFKFVGLREGVKTVMVVSKYCLNQYKSFLLVHKDGVINGKSEESSGRLLCSVLDIGRYASVDLCTVALSSKAQRIVRSVNDLGLLRRGDLYGDLIRLNGAMYSYWYSTPATPKSGVYHYMQECAAMNQSTIPEMSGALEADVKHWINDRVYGDFFVLVERRDGTILVSNDFQKVYLVLGLAQSIAEIIPGYTRKEYEVHGAFVKSKSSMTLLNWRGKVVYDGLMVSSMDTGKKSQWQKAVSAYINAVDSGSVISVINRTPIVTEPAAKPSVVVPKETVLRLQPAVEKLKKVPMLPGGDACPSIWIFRRHGYSERENPSFAISIFSSTAGGVLVPYFEAKQLIPDAEDYMKLLEIGIAASGKKPSAVSIDEESMVEPMGEILRPAGIDVAFYPPPSEEERAESDRTNPYTKGLRFSSAHVIACYYCGRQEDRDGVTLLRCSRCRITHYCSKEHQKADWKTHKRFCVPSSS